MQGEPGKVLIEKMQVMSHALNQLISLERETQRVLKLPADQFMDGIPQAMQEIEQSKEALMQSVERISTEVIWLRERLTANAVRDPLEAAAIDERNLLVRQALSSLQRLHKESERILKLRLTLLSQDMHQVEQSRQFLRVALQTVAC